MSTGAFRLPGAFLEAIVRAPWNTACVPLVSEFAAKAEPDLKPRYPGETTGYQTADSSTYI
jgi:hypothetical protein